jgi:hypothetical protein
MNAFFGSALTTGESMMQVPDTDAKSCPFRRFRMARSPRCVLRRGQVYSQALVILMMQSTACMALHSVQERCCHGC